MASLVLTVGLAQHGSCGQMMLTAGSAQDNTHGQEDMLVAGSAQDNTHGQEDMLVAS